MTAQVPPDLDHELVVPSSKFALNAVAADASWAVATAANANPATLITVSSFDDLMRDFCCAFINILRCPETNPSWPKDMGKRFPKTIGLPSRHYSIFVIPGYRG